MLPDSPSIVDPPRELQDSLEETRSIYRRMPGPRRSSAAKERSTTMSAECAARRASVAWLALFPSQAQDPGSPKATCLHRANAPAEPSLPTSQRLRTDR